MLPFFIMVYKTLILVRSVEEYVALLGVLGDLFKPYDGGQLFPNCIEMSDEVAVLLGINRIKFSTIKVPVVNTQKE